MSATTRHRRVRAVLSVGLAWVTGVALAQSAGGDFRVTKSVVAGGSATASGGAFRSSATAGQHDAGTAQGGAFSVQGGFWPATGAAQGDTIFRSGFEG